jgi:hypothetical protein
MQEDTQFSKELIEHLLVDLSIWIPRNFYTKLPVILPYVVRDNSCRIKTSSGHDEWGSANSRGYLRDDNTLLKGIVRFQRMMVKSLEQDLWQAMFGGRLP